MMMGMMSDWSKMDERTSVLLFVIGLLLWVAWVLWQQCRALEKDRELWMEDWKELRTKYRALIERNWREKAEARMQRPPAQGVTCYSCGARFDGSRAEVICQGWCLVGMESVLWATPDATVERRWMGVCDVCLAKKVSEGKEAA